MVLKGHRYCKQNTSGGAQLMKNLQKIKIHGELALAAVIVLNSLGVVLMLYSGSGISAISSVPYAFSFL